MTTVTAVLDVQGLQWATSVPVVESTLLRRPGVTGAINLGLSEDSGSSSCCGDSGCC